MDLQRQEIKIKKIRGQYTEKKQGEGIERLVKLDKKVKLPGTVFAYTLGTAGTLLLGAGMSNIMVWENMNAGLLMGIPGLVAACLAYPFYKMITKKRKKKYADRIFDLSEKIIHEQ